MKTVTVIIAVLVIAVVVAEMLVAVIAARWGRRSYQRYSGLERRRAAAKRGRLAGADRLLGAGQYLTEAQRLLADAGGYQQAQAIERSRIRLSTMADRHRRATYGYAPLGSPNPIRKPNLPTCSNATPTPSPTPRPSPSWPRSSATRPGQDARPACGSCKGALDDLEMALNRRKAAT